MVDNVILFPDPRASCRPGAIRCEELDLVFPELVRVVGNSWIRTNAGDYAPSRDLKRGYCLAEREDHGLCNVEREVITHLDDDGDYGVLTIRHHRTEESVTGYINAIWDFYEEPIGLDQIAFETNRGWFTLLHRPAPRSLPDRLVIYQAEIPHPFGWDRWQLALDRYGRSYDLFQHLPWVM
jgi:hypothetical protein